MMSKPMDEWTGAWMNQKVSGGMVYDVIDEWMEQ